MLADRRKEYGDNDLSLRFPILAKQQRTQKHPCKCSKQLLPLHACTNLKQGTDCHTEEGEGGDTVVSNTMRVKRSGLREMSEGNAPDSVK